MSRRMEPESRSEKLGPFQARCGERNGDAACAGAPFDYRSGFAFGEGEPERQIVVMGVLEVVEVG